MSRIQVIEQEIQKLSPQELTDLREWFAQYDAEAWDQKLEQDVKEGKLDALAEQALRDHKEGKSYEL